MISRYFYRYILNFQLYIKARGLDHLRFGKIIDTENGGQINLNKLRTILSSLKMPTVTKKPVHLEIIVQIEGKTILFFFLNQQSFNALTEGDSELKCLTSIKNLFFSQFLIFPKKNFTWLKFSVLNRIMKLLHMDSHINLQNVRWPIHSKYSVPTVLGTRTSLTVQSTLLSSLRGNITQSIEGVEIARSHEIDLR